MTKKYATGVRGLIFDYGGTIDTGGDHWSWVMWEAWRQAGIEVPLEVFRQAYVYGEREVARTRHILPEHDFADVLRIKTAIQLQWLARQNLLPADKAEALVDGISSACHARASASVEAAIPVLKALSEHYPMVVVSNFYGNLETVLRSFGIRNFFKKVMESAVVGVRKPDSAIFTMGVEALGLRPEECLVVGDSYLKDVVPALEAGCRAVLLKGRGWSGENDSEGYAQTIANLSELPEILS